MPLGSRGASTHNSSSRGCKGNPQFNRNEDKKEQKQEENNKIEEPVPMAQDNRKGKQEENQEGCNKKTKKTISQSFQTWSTQLIN